MANSLKEIEKSVSKIKQKLKPRVLRLSSRWLNQKIRKPYKLNSK